MLSVDEPLRHDGGTTWGRAVECKQYTDELFGLPDESFRYDYLQIIPHPLLVVP